MWEEQEFDFSEASPALDPSDSLIPSRVFLGWDVSLLSGVKSWLLDDARCEGLANTLVVVPTSNSGRRLRMALSEGAGVLSPHVMPPSSLFSIADRENVASRQESLWAWVEAIRSIRVEDFPHLFPNHESGATKSFSAALALARQMMTLRDMLADGDADFHLAQQHSIESERWSEIVALESRMLKCLAGWQLDDSVLEKRRAAHEPVLPTGIDRVVMACVPDPTLLALRAVQSFLSRGVPVTVLIHAPSVESAAFDEWGIPQFGYWGKKEIDIPEWRQRLHVVDSATEAAEVCVKAFAEGQCESDQAALALCDPTFAPALNKEFSNAGWKLFDPEGKRLIDSGVMRVFRIMRSLCGDSPSFESMREWVKLPLVESVLPEGVDRHRAALLLDSLYVKHLPETVKDAQYLAHGEVEQLISALVDYLNQLKTGRLSSSLRLYLVDWLGCFDQDVVEACEPVIAEVLDAVEHLEDLGENPRGEEVFDLLAESLQSSRVSSDRADTALDLQGWLEISYDSAAHLVLAGMHEECVPDGSTDDAFVPDSLRESLSLRDSQGRFARDAFLLKSAIESRRETGRVDAVITRFNDQGEARKPSRLLMCQKGAELAALVKYLFAESESTRVQGGAWERDWRLDLPVLENPYARGGDMRSLSPSAIKDYLHCPLRFYLKRILGMRIYEAEKREMNAMDFGNICHKVLELFGKNVEVRESADVKEIDEFLSSTLEDVVQRQYGNKLGLPLMVQQESARERLRAFASKQAEDRAKGWSIIETELEVGVDVLQWAIAGHPVRMTIDRIDRNEDGSCWRVWDYKTSGSAYLPEDQHLKSWKEEEGRALLAELMPPRTRSKVMRRWADVQLPLYAAFVKQHFNTPELPEVGYINLPRAVSDVGFYQWSSFDQEAVSHAMSWAEAAVEAIQSGEFSSPAKLSTQDLEIDDFVELAPDGLGETFTMTNVIK